MKNKAVILFSGGLDSSTVLYLAKQKFECFCLTFDYGQRHKLEISRAKQIAQKAGVDIKIVRLKFPHSASSLLDKNQKLPIRSKVDILKPGIPSTYVPARNTVFISCALSYAEAMNAQAVFIGANAIDFSGYPDCRPKYFAAFRRLVQAGLKNSRIKIVTPLLKLTKAQIVRKANSLAVPLELTWSCYKGAKNPCGVCDSCVLRQKGFAEAKIKDPAIK